MNFHRIVMVIIFIVILSPFFGYYFLLGSKYAYECEHYKVVEIVSVNYRTVTVKLENGQIIELDQPSNLKVGNIQSVNCKKESIRELKKRIDAGEFDNKSNKQEP